MTKEETLKIMAVLRGAYPSFYRDMDKTEALDVVNLWAEMFADDDVLAVANAVKTLIASDTKGYPPNIGAVKEQMRKILASQGSGYAWQALIDSGKVREPELGSVSRYARLHGISWEEAKQLSLSGNAVSGFLTGRTAERESGV